MSERREIHYSGRVQGVGFRYTARQIAGRYPVSGFVQNLPDGRVLLVAEGETEGLNEFLTALESEMPAYIKNKDVKTLAASGQFTRFEVRH